MFGKNSQFHRFVYWLFYRYSINLQNQKKNSKNYQKIFFFLKNLKKNFNANMNQNNFDLNQILVNGLLSSTTQPSNQLHQNGGFRGRGGYRGGRGGRGGYRGRGGFY